MLQESLIYKCIYAMWDYLCRSYNESLIVLAFRKLWAVLSGLFSSSAILRFIGREGFITRTWSESYIFRLADALVNLPQRMLHPLYKKAGAAFTESFFFKIILLVLNRLHMLVAFFLFVMLIVPHKYWNNVYSLAVVLILLLLFFLKTVVEGRTGFHLKIFNVFLLLFVLCVILAEVFSIIPKESLRFLAFYFTCFIMVLLLMGSVRNRDELSAVIAVILAGMTISGLYGMYQKVVGIPVNPSQIDITLNEGALSRVYSAFENPNNFAAAIIMLLPFYMALALNIRNFLMKLFILALALPPLISLTFTLSRSGWIGFAVAVLVFVFFKEKRLIPVFILLGILAFPFLPQSIYRRILTITNPADTSSSTRLDEYRTVLPILKNHWFAGLGLGNVTLVKVIPNYFIFIKGGKILQHSHNLYLQIWFEMGIAGILSFLAFLASTVKRSIKAIYSSEDRQVNNILIAGVSSLAGILVMGFADYVWFYPRVMLIFWVVIGLMLAALSILAGKSGKDVKA